ncbi:MAG: hypothetical protein KJ930_12140 [Gammaproteobacteria bacterium]|jgi:hypothetical protein|nr:hypothetical protein [Gammaproteobacteria bacterium]MBU2180169.1 hypothetical protein [Gammaproteobacteria bacterium]MBU2223958.1 hypothetical protein [Gammaproteobacteria bacterium]MBU2279614.1 hypothetical protein [Gammaproteobacteria bacterium]MBU2427755.1 hypothetical protein [Gammaproteobacteria bacterium]
MESRLVNKIWPNVSARWFKSEENAPVPHEFSEHHIGAEQLITKYLHDSGLQLAPGWRLDNDFYENMKRWIGACSAPQQILNGTTPTQPFYLSFFPFIFEIALSIMSANPQPFITRPGFLKNSKTFVINDDQPKIVELCINGILERLFGKDDPHFGFIYLVLVNDGGKSNIKDMGFEDNGNFWLQLQIGLSQDTIDRINNKYAVVTGNRAAQIQKLRIYLASADSYIQLDAENRGEETFLVFRQKVLSPAQSTSLQAHHPESSKTQDHPTYQTSDRPINNGPMFQGGTFNNIQIGDHNNQQFSSGKSSKK